MELAETTPKVREKGCESILEKSSAKCSLKHRTVTPAKCDSTFKRHAFGYENKSALNPVKNEALPFSYTLKP